MNKLLDIGNIPLDLDKLHLWQELQIDCVFNKCYVKQVKKKLLTLLFSHISL